MSVRIFDFGWILYRMQKHTCAKCGETLLCSKGEKAFHCPICKTIVSVVEQKEHERNILSTDKALSVDAIAEITNGRATHTFFGAEYRGCCEIKSHYKTSCLIRTVDKQQINYDETKECNISFITPKFYPASIWVGKTMELYEGERCVGHMEITEISNAILDRNKVFQNRTDVLTDYRLLNRALKLSLEWGKEWERPLNNKIMKAVPYLSGSDIDQIADYIVKVRDDVIWRIYYDHYDYISEDFKIDVEAATKEKYPWIDSSNLLSLHSQGRYYAWHG